MDELQKERDELCEEWALAFEEFLIRCGFYEA